MNTQLKLRKESKAIKTFIFLYQSEASILCSSSFLRISIDTVSIHCVYNQHYLYHFSICYKDIVFYDNYTKIVQIYGQCYVSLKCLQKEAGTFHLKENINIRLINITLSIYDCRCCMFERRFFNEAKHFQSNANIFCCHARLLWLRRV